MYLLDDLASQFSSVQKQATVLMQAKAWVEKNQERFNHLPTAMVWNSGDRVCIDFDRMSHAQVMQIVLAFGRPWARKANEDRIDYIHDISPTLRIRCFQGEPPPNCKVEYVEETIPAQPERTVRKAKIVCQPVTHSLPNGAAQLTNE